LQGKVRQVVGWTIIIFSDLAFGAALIFMIRRLFVTEYAEHTLVNVSTLLMDLGLGAVLFVLGGLMVWRLIDLLTPRGRWRREYAEEVGQ
jgi:uncharacterized membrane protein (DUF373 family)